jgi:deoxycytidylate deaminase
MQVAINAAKTIDINQKHRLGAVIYNRGRLVSIGINKLKTHPRALKAGYRWAKVHCELDALIKADPSFLVDAICYVARINKSGKNRLSKSCETCQELLRDNGIKCIYYTTNEDFIGKLLL